MQIAEDERRGTRPQTIRYTPDTTWVSTIPARPEPAKRTVQSKAAQLTYRNASIDAGVSAPGKPLAKRTLANMDKLIIIIALMLAVYVWRDDIRPMIAELVADTTVQSVRISSLSPFHQQKVREFAFEKNAQTVFFRYTETGNIRLCSSRIPESLPPDARWIRITGL